VSRTGNENGGGNGSGKKTRRRVLIGGGAAVGLASLAWAFRRRVTAKLARWTMRADFSATPPLRPHDPASERRSLYLARDGTPAENIDAVLAKLGGIDKVVAPGDVVLLKVSAQWWNQGMTNVAATRRAIEHILEIPGFHGEVLVLENVHFRLADGSGLARAWTHPSERNVDVDGWSRLGDLVGHFRGKPVGFVGLVDAGPSALAGDPWHDPGHAHGAYGGDGRGPIAAGEDRDGYRWDFAQAFRLRRSLVDSAQTPLTWPVFTSPVSGLVVDLRDGVFQRKDGGRVPAQRKLTWITLTTANEHGSTGYTGCCKSAMGIVDMSAGRLGTHPAARGYQSVHYFGEPSASWRMAGPLADFARKVRAPDLYLTVAEWVGAQPAGWAPAGEVDLRHAAECAHRTRTVVAGVDPVAVDSWVVRNLLMPIRGLGFAEYDLDSEHSKVTRFLRYYREVYGSGTLDAGLVQVV
jgi:uncharacterized protein DUF362